VPRRGRRTSAIDVALQGLSVSAQLRSGPESGPIYTLSQSDDLWLAPKAGRVGRSASGPLQSFMPLRWMSPFQNGFYKSEPKSDPTLG